MIFKNRHRILSATILIAVLAAQARDEELELHTAVGIRHGLTRTEIEEINLHVRDDGFKVQRFARQDEPPVKLSQYQSYVVEWERIRDWFAENVDVSRPLSDELRARLRETILEHEVSRDLDLDRVAPRGVRVASDSGADRGRHGSTG